MNEKQKQREPKPQPKINNDQLGENASMEFAEDYDNKTKQPLKKPNKQ